MLFVCCLSIITAVLFITIMFNTSIKTLEVLKESLTSPVSNHVYHRQLSHCSTYTSYSLVDTTKAPSRCGGPGSHQQGPCEIFARQVWTEKASFGVGRSLSWELIAEFITKLLRNITCFQSSDKFIPHSPTISTCYNRLKHKYLLGTSPTATTENILTVCYSSYISTSRTYELLMVDASWYASSDCKYSFSSAFPYPLSTQVTKQTHTLASV